MEFQIVNVTPNIAKSWLMVNHRNRPLHKHHVETLASAMKRGEWKVNGEAVKFTKDGFLVDGQHRLQAVVMADCCAEMLVIRGIQQEAFDTMDQGSKRTAGDILAVKGESETSHLAAAARLVYLMDKSPDVFLKNESVTPIQIEKTLQRFPELRDSMSVGRTWKQLLPKATAGGMWVLCSRKNMAMANEFFDRVASGSMLEDTDPEKVLRDALIDNAISQKKMTKAHLIAFVIKAWNAKRLGKKMKILRFKDDESFPVLI